MDNFDLIVIGGGPGDMFVRYAAQLGLKIACVGQEAL